jgi:hypothetical protein
LNNHCHEDALQMAGAWHHALKSHFSGSPSTVFMGGSLDKTFHRVLQSAADGRRLH